MARRRMFSMELCSSDRFLSLEPTAQSFYFHLGIHADDEGFVAAPNSLALLCKGSAADLQALEDKGFIIRFSSGVVVIVDWMLNNTIRKDRSMDTMHRAEKAMLTLVDGRYVRKDQAPEEPKAEAPVTTNVTTENDHFFSDDSVPQNRVEQNISEYITPEQNTPMHYVPDLDEDNGWAFGEYLDRMAKLEEEKKNGYENLLEKPSLDTVLQFCREENLHYIKPREFWSYYNRVGWLDKEKKPILDWKCVAKSWNERNKRINKPTTAQ